MDILDKYSEYCQGKLALSREDWIELEERVYKAMCKLEEEWI